MPGCRLVLTHLLPGMKVDLKDGLYQVITSYLCAGFVVKDGVVVDAAPILWKRLPYWVTIARYVG